MWRKTRKAVAARNDLSAFIDEGSEIEGKYTFSGTVMLNGKFHGEIASADTLIIGEKGVVNANVRVRKLAASPAALQRELAEQQGIVTALRTRIAEIRLEIGSWRELDAKIWEPFGPDVGLVRKTLGIGGATALPEPVGRKPSALEELEGLAETVGEAGQNLRALERLMEHAGKALALMPSRWPVRGAVNSEFGTRPSPWTGAEEFHSGLDIAADRGTGVHAPAPGTVVFAGEQGEFGLCLVL